jgi:hypothetical protein
MSAKEQQYNPITVKKETLKAVTYWKSAGLNLHRLSEGCTQTYSHLKFTVCFVFDAVEKNAHQCKKKETFKAL